MEKVIRVKYSNSISNNLTVLDTDDITAGVYFFLQHCWPGVTEHFTVRPHILGVIYMAAVDRGKGQVHTDPPENLCVSWTLITWSSDLSDVILMTRRSIKSRPWTPKESSLPTPLWWSKVRSFHRGSTFKFKNSVLTSTELYSVYGSYKMLLLKNI